MHQFDFVQSGKRTITIERDAVTELEQRIDGAFANACELLLACKGRVIVTGMGKSGHIGRKIAATLASTGTPAFFVHPGEASHGDLGMITADDVVIAISSSGGSPEIVSLLPLLKRKKLKLIAMVGRNNSTLAQVADVVLDISIAAEACPLDLAPTSSTTVTLVMGDALAIALLEARGFTAEDFAHSHPGGILGRKLLLRVEDVMHAGSEVPRVRPDTPLLAALAEMTEKGFGMTTVVDGFGQLLGIFTDGDLRRCIDRREDVNRAVMKDVMTPSPRTIRRDSLAAEALNRMETFKITALIVEDENGSPTGVLHMHDLLRAGLA